jgi:hypothetical protein
MSQPEISFKVGAVRAAIFRNTMQRGTKTINIGKVILEVRYRDKDGQWKSTHSMSANEVPKAILALQKAYEYLMTKKSDESQQDVDDTTDAFSVAEERIG